MRTDMTGQILFLPRGRLDNSNFSPHDTSQSVAGRGDTWPPCLGSCPAARTTQQTHRTTCSGRNNEIRFLTPLTGYLLLYAPYNLLCSTAARDKMAWLNLCTYLLGTKFCHSFHHRMRAQMTTRYMNPTDHQRLNEKRRKHTQEQKKNDIRQSHQIKTNPPPR